MMRPRLTLLLGALAVAVLAILGRPPSLSAASQPKCNVDNVKIAVVPVQPQTSVTIATVPDNLVIDLNLTPAAMAMQDPVIARGSPSTVEQTSTADINANYDDRGTTAIRTRSPSTNDQTLAYMTMPRESGGDLAVDDDTGNHSGALGASTRASPAFNSQTVADHLPSSG